MNTFRNYADYEIPLLQVLSDLPGGQGASREVKDRFGVRFDDRIPDDHRVYLKNVRETKWRNIVAWVRNGLINRGLMDSPAYGIWRITDAGRAHLAQANNSASPPMVPSRESGPALSSDRTHTLLIAGQSITLSAEDVLAIARRAIVQGLPPAAQNFQSWVVEVDGQQVGVKWLFGLATGMSHADFKLNQARRAFEHLGLAVHRIEDTTANEVAEAISVERPRIEARIETTTRAHIIIDTQIATVRDFLNGRAGRPSDERLCDWVHLCYEYELYREGRDLFALVDPAQVNSWYYERAKRLAKVCAMKVAGHA